MGTSAKAVRRFTPLFDLREASTPLRGSDTIELLGTGASAFPHIVERIGKARERISIRAFLWRDDEAGNELAEAVLAAADRGVDVAIHKDRIAAVYEYTGGNKQSFFHKKIDPVRGFQAWFLSRVYNAPGSMKQKPNLLRERILAHPRISVDIHSKRFDHAKVFVIDDTVILGSMGIGDNHHREWIDMMVALHGGEHVARLEDRLRGAVPFEPARGVDFLVHSQRHVPRRVCAMVGQRLSILESARQSISIEMAYLGDRRFTDALLRALERGVSISLVTAARADVLGNLNHAVCNVLLRKFPGKVRVALHPRMVHSKVVVVDGRFVDIGSANFTPLSHGVYDEVNVFADCAPFAQHVEAHVEKHFEEGAQVEGIRHRPISSGLERAIMAYQARRGG